MLRRLHAEQPETFAFTRANLAWAEAQMTKYPEGRQASAIIPLLWRAQEQAGWLTRPAIEHVAELLGLAYIRALEVATFYFMFQLQPVGRTAHIQICGTTSCMICGAEDLVEVCKREIAARPHEISGDGQLSWEEVECLGACANAPMAQIGKDYYEDLTPERLTGMLSELRAGSVPVPGSQTGRFASEPLGGATTLTEHAEDPDHALNASVTLAVELGDTVRRIDGTEVPLTTPWHRAEQADPDPETAARDPNLGPAGPDGPQGGTVRGTPDADRERGDASDGVANVRGSDADPTGHPEEGQVAPEPESDATARSGEPVADLAARDKAAATSSSEGEPAGRRDEDETVPTSKAGRANPADAGTGTPGGDRPKPPQRR